MLSERGYRLFYILILVINIWLYLQVKIYKDMCLKIFVFYVCFNKNIKERKGKKK